MRHDQKICLITGANSGIGKVTARTLAQQGIHIIMLCRSAERGQAAREEIIEQTGNKNVDLHLADFANLADVKKAADKISRAYPRLDILINNAGYLPAKRELLPSGLEKSFCVNQLAPFLLTNILLPSLKAAPAARIINVSSDIYRISRIPWADLSFEKKFGPYYTYGVAKLANVMWTLELVKRLEGTNITANTLHPGYIASGFGMGSRAYIRFAINLVRPMLRTSEEGARTMIYLASSQEADGVTGQYFKDEKTTRITNYASNPEHTARLWKVCEEMVASDLQQSK